MIVHVPEQDLIARCGPAVAGRGLRIGRPAEDIVAFDGFVFAVEDIAMPVAMKDTLDPADFIAGSLVDWPPALRRSAHDFDLEPLRVIDQAAVALDTVVSDPDQRHLMPGQRRFTTGFENVLGLFMPYPQNADRRRAEPLVRNVKTAASSCHRVCRPRRGSAPE